MVQDMTTTHEHTHTRHNIKHTHKREQSVMQYKRIKSSFNSDGKNVKGDEL